MDNRKNINKKNENTSKKRKDRPYEAEKKEGQHSKKARIDLSADIEQMYFDDYSSDTEDELSDDETYTDNQPYKFYVNENKRGKLGNKDYINSQAIKINRKYFPSIDRQYVINIPVIASEKKKSLVFHEMVKNESFGDNEKDSPEICQRRVSLAMAVNKPKSVISERNQVFYNEMNTPIKTDYPCNRVGFFWKPSWEMLKSDPWTVHVKKVDSLKNKKKWKMRIPTLYKDESTQNVYVYGKWLNEKEQHTLLGNNIFSHLFIDTCPYEITVSFNENQEVYDKIVAIKAHSGKTRPVGLGTVRSWYKRMGEDEGLDAHIQYEEGKPKNAMIPYRELRDKLKNDEITQELLGTARRRAGNKETYISFLDNSVESLHAENGNGIFSVYDEMINEYKKTHQKPPVVVTSGYGFDANKYPLEAMGPRLDMSHRTQTNEYIENAVYVSESNFAVLAKSDKNYLEDFSIANERQYDQPDEWGILISRMIEGRKLDQDKPGIVFDGKYAISIEPRPRMLLKQGGKNKKEYRGKYNQDGKIIRWNKQDCINFKNISQSSCHPLKWATAIVKKYKEYEGFDLRSDEICEMNGLVSKLLNIYDPISILTKSDDIDFIKPLINVLNNYDQIISSKNEELDEIVNDIIELSPFFAEYVGDICYAAKACGAEMRNILKQHICTDYAEIINYLTEHFVNEVEDEAKNIQSEVKKEFGGLSHNKYHEEIIQGDESNIKVPKMLKNQRGKHGFSYLHCAAISGNSEYIKASLASIDKNIKAEHGILPIHCAVIHHIEQRRDMSAITLLADENNLFSKMSNGKTPLYYIVTEIDKPESMLDNFLKSGCVDEQTNKILLRYLQITHDIEEDELGNPLLSIIRREKNSVWADFMLKLFVNMGASFGNGNDLALFLADKRKERTSRSVRKNALLYILTDVDEAQEIITFLDKNNYYFYTTKPEIRNSLINDMLNYLGIRNRVPRDEWGDPMLLSVHYGMDSGLIRRLLGLFTILSNECPSEAVIFEAIHKHDINIVEKIFKLGGEFENIHDEKGYPPILSAMSCKASIKMFDMLLECGANLSEPDINDISCPVHETVSGELFDHTNTKLLRYFLKKKPSCITDEYGEETLLDVALNGGSNKALSTLILDDDDNIREGLEDEINELSPDRMIKLRERTGIPVYNKRREDKKEAEAWFRKKQGFFSRIHYPVLLWSSEEESSSECEESEEESCSASEYERSYSSPSK